MNVYASILPFHGYAEDINAMYNIKDKLIPCLELVTSDIGENAFEATGYWKTPNGAKIYGSSFKREHRGTVTCKAATGAAKGKHDTIRDIIRQGVEENIFDKYTKLPERLLERFRSTLHRRIWILPKHAAADAMQKQWLLLFSTFSANYIFHRSFPLNGSGVFLKIASNTDRLMNPCAIRRMILP